MINIQGKKICIIGAKRSARALCELVLTLKGIPHVSDNGFDATFATWSLEKGIAYEHGQHTKDFIQNTDLVVLSPGVSISVPVVQWAREKHIPVLGEIEFAYQFCHKPVIAVTGSNGKTTVSTLIHQLLTRSGHKSSLGGNIGRPFASFCLEAGANYFVLEISSFQMESVLDPKDEFCGGKDNGHFSFKGFQPHLGILLNFSDNHLDRHKDMLEYFEAKKRLFINQTKSDYALLTGQNERIKGLKNELNGSVVFFDDDQVKGRFKSHNPNHLVMRCVAEILHIDQSICDKVLADFKGVEHRLEWVRNLNGVDYVNDSKATTAEAGRWALNSIQRPVVMICGGRDKNIDFSVLKTIVRDKVKHMVVFGEARDKLRKVFEDVVLVQEAGDLKNAVEQAKSCAKDGDCVVLSPMCASFDMFKDYEDRGRVFKQIVRELS